MYWSVRRELWENRSIYVAPAAVAVLILVASLVGLIDLPEKIRAAVAAGPARQQKLIEEPYTFAALLLMFTTMVVGVFYCVDALYGERRDRSVLFWKSLPVSDLTTVLAKASIPLVILPLLTFALTVVTQGIMLLLASARLAGTGLNATLWSHISFGQMAWLLLYHLVAVHSLSWAPLWGWLLLASAWSRRAPFLWAALPPLAVGLLERIAFNTSHFGNWLAHRVSGGAQGAPPGGDQMTMASMTASPGQFLTSPGFWFGLAVAAAFLAAAVRLRRYRGPI
jgi:ABC-2 type transport system permease protein